MVVTGAPPTATLDTVARWCRGLEPSGCTYELAAGSSAILAALATTIRGAASTLDMQFYTFECDRAGEPLARELAEAASRGVRVRLLVDDYINLAHNDHYLRAPRRDRALHRSIRAEWQATQALLASLRRDGVEVRMANPLRRSMRNVLARDHRKIVVADAAADAGTAFLGGFNPSDHNASWNDFMVAMTGDMVPLIASDFEANWSGNPRGGVAAYSEGALLAEVRGCSTVIPVAVDVIDQARNRVMLESAYLWGRPMLGALTRAARRGVEVSVIVPLHNHKRLFTPSARTIARLDAAGARVFGLTTHGGMTHARALLADRLAIFGSNAFNGVLAGVMGELNLLTANPTLGAQLERFLLHDVDHSVRLG